MKMMIAAMLLGAGCSSGASVPTMLTDQPQVGGSEDPRTEVVETVVAGVTLRGVVVDARERSPLAGARVSLCTRGLDEEATYVNRQWPDCFQQLAETVTGDDGTFTMEWKMPADEGHGKLLPGLEKHPPTASALIVSHDGYAAVLVAGERLRQATTGPLLNVELAPFAVVAGTVVAASPPPQEIEIGWFVERPKGLTVRHSTQRGGSGRFRLDDVPAGEVTVYAIDSGSRRQYGITRLKLEPGQTRAVNVTLDRPLLGIKGQLVDATGHPLSMARLAVKPPAGVTQTAFGRVLAAIQERYDPSRFVGEFDLMVEAPGAYDLRFRAEGCETSGGIEHRILTDVRAKADRAGTPLTVAAPHGAEVVSCSFADESGAPVGIWQYDVYCLDPNSHVGSGHSGGDIAGVSPREPPTVSDIRFVWPSGAHRIALRLQGTKVAGQVELASPQAPCHVVGKPTL